MNRSNKFLTIWEHYLTREISIEFKACLYFFCFLFYYSVYRLSGKIYTAEILHMAEMIGVTYIMGYVQVYLLSNFDEGEHFRQKEWLYTLLCTALYTFVSVLWKWFDRHPLVTAGFALYTILIYCCTFLVYRSKRRIDEKLLNEDLKAFQERSARRPERSDNV